MYFGPTPLYSQHLQTEKAVWVYLPPGYDENEERYPVIYMQDGQNLFDAEAAFGGQEWEVDETLDALNATGRGGFIVVGVPAGEDRLAEYAPYATEALPAERGRAYMRFVTEELMPHVNEAFRTHTGPAHTAIVGSSMGALVSLHAILEHEAHFGTAGIFSIAQAKELPSHDFLVDQVHQHGPRPAQRRVFIYYGGQEMHGLPETSHRLHEAFSTYPHHQAQIMMHPEADHAERYWALAFQQFVGWHLG